MEGGSSRELDFGIDSISDKLVHGQKRSRQPRSPAGDYVHIGEPRLRDILPLGRNGKDTSHGWQFHRMRNRISYQQMP